MNPSTLAKFIRWFVVPLNTLRNLPEGDGAFVALSIGFQLCERFYRAQTGTQDNWRNDTFKDSAADDLGVDRQIFRRFWDVFRNGLQHQGSPKHYQHEGISYKWEISSDLPPVNRTSSYETIHPGRSPERIESDAKKAS